jgi:hypothetical protein
MLQVVGRHVSQQELRFDLRPVRFVFVVDKVALEKVFLSISVFRCQYYSTYFSYSFIDLRN